MTADNPILAEIQRVATAIAFAAIAREESKRTLLCSSADVDRVRWYVDQSGSGDVFTVVESPHVPVGQMYVMDQQAIEADTAAVLQRGWRL